MKNVEEKLKEGDEKNIKWEKHKRNELLGIDDELEEEEE